MSFSVKKMLYLVVISILLATQITFTYLHFRCENLSQEIGRELNNNLSHLTTKVLKLQENQKDHKSMSDLVMLVLSSRSLRSVAYLQNQHYIYSDRDSSLHKSISDSLKQKIKQNTFPLLYKKRSSLNNVDELHLVVKGKQGYYQLFMNARYMDDWLTNADEYLRGYVTSLDNSLLINNKANFLFKKKYRSTQFPFIVVLGAKTDQILFCLGGLSAFIFIILLLGMLIIDNIKKQQFSFKKDIERAIRNNEFIPFYQPIICNKTKQCLGAELLCRWHHRHNKMMNPDQFITKVESSGQIKAITLQLIKQLAIDKPIISNNNSKFYVSINFTLAMLSDPLFIDDVIELIKKNKALQSGLVFEITERENTMNAFQRLDKIMQQFRELGVCWALDDFGTGYSSLSSLKELNFDIIKIDKLFINTADTDAITGSILNNIASLGKILKFRLIAEGVETETQLNKIISLNIDYTQGYYFSKPVNRDDFKAFCKNHNENYVVKHQARYRIPLQYHGPTVRTS